jgi:membrane associated rhomboid family serine protease
MLPIQDTAPRKTFPFINWLLILANIAVFAFEVLLPENELQRLIDTYALIPAHSSSHHRPLLLGYSRDFLVTFLSSTFLHGGIMHLLGNIWTLVIFGDNVEDALGHFRYAFFYLFCGAASSLAHVMSSTGSTVPTLGASGAIAGVLGAYYCLFPFAQIILLVPVFIYPLFVPVPAFLFLGYWFFLQLASGQAMLGHAEAGGIAFWGHIGGFVAGGTFYGLFMRPTRKRQQ